MKVMALDQSIFQGKAHPPGVPSLERALDLDPGSVKDFGVPVNAYFPPGALMRELQEELPHILRYYPSRQEDLLDDLSRFVGLPAQQLVLSNGSTEIITFIDRLFVKDSLLTEIPTFGRWTDQTKESGKRLETFLLQEEPDFAVNADAFVDKAKSTRVNAFVLSSPNNPTGKIVPVATLTKIFESLRDLDLIVIDESFLEFSALKVDSAAKLVEEFPNLLILRSLGKNFGLHGLRMGYAVTNPARASLLRAALPPWNLNAVAEHFLRKAFREPVLYEQSRRLSIHDAERLEMELREIRGIQVFTGQCNFRYVKVLEPVCGQVFRDTLLKEHRMLVRECASKIGSSKQFLRIASRPYREVQALATAIADTLKTLRT